MPELPPKVETTVIVAFFNEQLNVTCPGLEFKKKTLQIYIKTINVNL